MPSEQSATSSSPPSRRRWLAERRGAIWLVSGGAIVLLAAAAGWRGAERTSNTGRGGFAANFDGGVLTTHDGKPFDFATLAGKVVLFNFMFTSCPTVCPTQTRALVQVQRTLNPSMLRKVHFVSVSLDPAHDEPATLHAFAQRMGVDFANWTFLTGSDATVRKLSERLRLFADTQSAQPDGHGTTLWLMDAQGVLLQRYPGNPPDVERLTEELRQLVALGQ